MKKCEEFYLDKGSIQERYEELRHEVIFQEEKGLIYSKGLALFIQQGMVGWLRVWSQCVVYADAVKEEQGEVGKDREYKDARREIIMIVANMVLSGVINKNISQEGLERCA